MTEKTAQQKWLDWAQKIQAIAQSGLTYCKDVYDIERYEQLCVIAAEMIAGHSEHDFSSVHALFKNETGYATPKLDCRGLVMEDEKVLLVREKSDGKWTLPGGWIDINESPRQAVEKEIREESGFTARAIRLLAVYDKHRHAHPPDIFHSYKLFFHCEIESGASRSGLETDGVEFFLPAALPQLSTGRILPEQIQHLCARLKAGICDTEFD